MRFEITFETSDGQNDSFIVEADTIVQITELANEGVLQRNGKNPWSEELE